MPLYTNGTGVPLSVAVYLATDNYDYEAGTISATGLMKPVRQTILSRRIPPEDASADIIGMVKSRTGTAIHDAIERAWKENYVKAMALLGYPANVIERVAINPDPDNLPEGAIPVYMEVRSYKDFMGKRISGKFDFVAEGRVEDFKSTSCFTWTQGNKDEDYQIQGSIYRWLNPKIITRDHMAIQFFFMDWMPGRAMQDPNYPKKPVETRLIPLLSLDDTEAYVASRIRLIEQHKDIPQEHLPKCNDKELWRKEDVFKVYKDPTKLSRCMPGGTFSSLIEARKFNQDKTGGSGFVKEIKGEVIACKYCNAFSICTQKDDLILDGSLIL